MLHNELVSITEIFESLPYGPAPESAGLANEWLDGHGREFGLFIGGEWRTAASGELFETLNPGNGRPIAKISQANETDVNAAVEAARAAQKGWWDIGGHARGRFLYALARQVQKHSRLFAVLESLDNGKPIRETRDLDIPLVARHFYYHAGWAQLMEKEMAGYEPVGVAGQIIPWNFPLLMLSWKIAPALAMGNTVVLKPAEYTPLTALLFAEICKEIGLPDGVVNIITGDGRTGKLIVEHPDIAKIAFTGSTEVGRIIRKSTAGTGKKLTLELGGKSPFIVFDDADIDSAVEGLVDAIWFNQGQVCCAGSRLLVQEGIAERVLQKVRERMENLRVGDPLDKAIDIGAIIAPVQLQRINELVCLGCDEGAELFQPSWACPQEGWFYPPTLLSNVGPASTVAQVEIFGPVLVAMTFRTPAEAVELANNTTYGLAASVWSENINLALDIAAKVKAGTVWVNCTNLFDAASGFGGYRESGFGREGGKEGLWDYVRETDTHADPHPSSPRSQSLPLSLRDKGRGEDTGSSTQGPDALPAEHPNTPTPQHLTSPTPSTDRLTPLLDRTHKQYVGGKQARPDSGYSVLVALQDGTSEEVARGNRKDVRNAVEAGRAAQPAWAKNHGHARAQVLYYLAENLETDAAVFVKRVEATGHERAREEVEASVQRLFSLAAWADKFEGTVHSTAYKGFTYTLNEPIGVMGIVCPDDSPLLSLVTAAGAAIAMGNAAVVLPSQTNPLPAVELYRVLDASDVPAGVFNILTGPHEEMAEVLAAHDGVDALWHFGDGQSAAACEVASAGNLKQTWTTLGKPVDWFSADERTFLRKATQVKNIWVPYGE